MNRPQKLTDLVHNLLLPLRPWFSLYIPHYQCCKNSSNVFVRKSGTTSLKVKIILVFSLSYLFIDHHQVDCVGRNNLIIQFLYIIEP